MMNDEMALFFARIANRCRDGFEKARSLVRRGLRWTRTKAEEIAGRLSWSENAKGAFYFSIALIAYQLNLPGPAVAFGTMAMWQGAKAIGWASCAIVISPRLQHPIKPIPRFIVHVRRAWRRWF